MTDIQSIVKQMTLEEKAALCTGASAWTTTPVERLGVPALFVSDGPHGVRRVPDVDSLSAQSLPATCFPTASCLSSSWDVDLLRELGEALAEECIALQVDVVLGPSINMKRTPLCGRNFEYYAEDPYLSGKWQPALFAACRAKGLGPRNTTRPTTRSSSGSPSIPRWTSAPCGRSTCPPSRPR